jgi:DNA-binding PadR family transcriptional regulator
LLDVSACLLRAARQGEAVHGWLLMKQAGHSGPTVYGVLGRLEDCGWVTGSWEDLGPEASRPRRRFYEVTASGADGIRRLLEERRPQALRELPIGSARPSTGPCQDQAAKTAKPNSNRPW